MWLGPNPRLTRVLVRSRRALSKTSLGAPECALKSPATTIAAQVSKPLAKARDAPNRSVSPTRIAKAYRDMARSVQAAIHPCTEGRTRQSAREFGEQLDMGRP